MAYTSIRFTNARNELVARGSHTKFVISSAVVSWWLMKFCRYIAIAWKDPDGQNIVDELKKEEKV